MTDLVVRVAVENTVYHFDRLFDYRVPKDLTGKIKIGCRTVVPFGRGNSSRIGMIMEIGSAEDLSVLKNIIEITDETPVLSPEMIKLVFFMKEHYFCTYYDAIKVMLPIGITYKLKEFVSVSNDLGDDIFDLPEDYRGVIKYITSIGGKIEKDRLIDQFSDDSGKLIAEMICDKVLVCEESFQRKIGDKTMKMVSLADDYESVSEGLRLSKKQQETIDTLKTVGGVSVKELTYYTGYTASVVETLVKKGIAFFYDDEVFRIPETAVSERKEYILSEEQKKAFDSLYSLYRDDKAHCALLYGITGSGKTSVFFKLIEEVIGDNRDVIVMVPEIALTPQLLSLFKSYFNDKVAVFHSALSLGERLDEYKRVRRGIAKIVIGTRSAVFAPLDNIGLIIMDEEQEHTYKSESTPRYHARDVAKYRCFYNNALLLLSSATPSVESYYNAQTGKYSIVTLRERYGNAVLPEVTVADMTEEVQRGNVGIYSDALLERIEENLNSGKQSILLLNRRGYNTFVSCRSCKEPVTCPNCSITLTYHSANKRLMCHYCGFSENVPHECPNCKSDKLRFSGFGTQRAVDDLSEIFPDARILRMDTDATMSKSSHERLLSAFSKGEYDILIGTQMVAKGLDFPNVTLVGILNADMMLFSDDYRSFENTFSLLTQVIGRSGRGDCRGTAVIQTTAPDSPIIKLSCEQDYDSFYEDEITVRKTMLYPPYVELVLVGFTGDNKNQVEKASLCFFSLITDLLKMSYPDMAIRLLGPSPMSVVKVNNRYRYKLIIKAVNNNKFRKMLREAVEQFSKTDEYKKCSIYVDVAPLSL